MAHGVIHKWRVDTTHLACLQIDGAAVAQYKPSDAPAAFVPPKPSVMSTMVAVAEGGVAPKGKGQRGAEGAYSVAHGHPARELWAADLNQPPKHCTACRGEQADAQARPHTMMLTVLHADAGECRACFLLQTFPHWGPWPGLACRGPSAIQ